MAEPPKDAGPAVTGESTPEGTPSLGRAAAAGTLWLVAQKWAVRATGFATIAMLTRLVTPEEFGVVAVASSLIPFILMLSEFGLSAYVVQADDISQRRLSTAFWFSIGVAVVLGSGLAAAAPIIARLSNVPAAAPVLQALAVSVVIVVMSSVPMALLRRAMAFRTLALQTTAATFIAQVGAVALALAGAGVWALVFQTLVSQAVATALAWWSARWLPSFEFSFGQLREIARFGVSIVSLEITLTLRTFAENALIAIVLGPVALGYLNIAQRLIWVMQDMGAVAVLPVSTVVFAKIRDTVPRLRAAYLRSVALANSMVAPLLGFVAASAPVLVPTFFGPEWTHSVVATQALAVAAVATLGAMLDRGLFDGLGRPGTWFLYALPVEIVAFGVTLAVVQHGVNAVAWGFAGVAIAAAYARSVLVSRFVAASQFAVFKPWLTALVPAALSVGAGWLAMQPLAGLPGLVVLAVGASVTGLAHVVFVRLLTPRVLTDLVTLLPVPKAARRVLDKFVPRQAESGPDQPEPAAAAAD